MNKASKQNLGDQEVIDLVKDNYKAPVLSRTEAIQFDEAIVSRASASRSVSFGQWALVAALLLVFTGIGLRNIPAEQPAELSAQVAVNDEEVENLEWVATLLDEAIDETEIEEFPEEYVAMMMIIGADSEEDTDY